MPGALREPLCGGSAARGFHPVLPLRGMLHSGGVRSVLARATTTQWGSRIDHYELGVAMAQTRLAELRRDADQRRLAGRVPGRTVGRSGNRTPGSAWVFGRRGQAVDCAGGTAATSAGVLGPAATQAAIPVEHPRSELRVQEFWMPLVTERPNRSTLKTSSRS